MPVADICETSCTAALTLARTYSPIEIVGIGERSVAVQYPIFDNLISLKTSIGSRKVSDHRVNAGGANGRMQWWRCWLCRDMQIPGNPRTTTGQISDHPLRI